MGDQRRGGFNPLGFLFDQVREAIADARSKLVEEGWFGRRSPGTSFDLGKSWNGPSIHDAGGSLPAAPSFEEAWRPRSPSYAQQAPANWEAELGFHRMGERAAELRQSREAELRDDGFDIDR